MRADEGKFNQIESEEDICEKQLDTLKNTSINGVFVRTYKDLCKAIEADENYRAGYSDRFFKGCDFKCDEDYNRACIKMAANLVSFVSDPKTFAPRFEFPAILIEKYSQPSDEGIPYLVYYTSCRTEKDLVSSETKYMFSCHTVLAMVYGDCSVKIFGINDLQLQNPLKDKSIFQFICQPCAYKDGIVGSI